MPFHPPTKEHNVNEQAPSYNDGLRESRQQPAPAWGESDLVAASARQSRANPALAAPYGAQAQASMAPPMAPMMPMAAPPPTIMSELAGLNNFIEGLNEDITGLAVKIDPVLSHNGKPAPTMAPDEQSDDGYVLVEIRRLRIRLADIRMLVDSLTRRVQLP